MWPEGTATKAGDRRCEKDPTPLSLASQASHAHGGNSTSLPPPRSPQSLEGSAGGPNPGRGAGAPHSQRCPRGTQNPTHTHPRPSTSPFTRNEKRKREMTLKCEHFLLRPEPGQVWEPVASGEGTPAALGHCDLPGGPPGLPTPAPLAASGAGPPGEQPGSREALWTGVRWPPCAHGGGARPMGRSCPIGRGDGGAPGWRSATHTSSAALAVAFLSLPVQPRAAAPT